MHKRREGLLEYEYAGPHWKKSLAHWLDLDAVND
jgi:hypothetical protein